MDQIKDLSAFQGVILSADNCHSFTKITSKGGNEEKVKYVIDKLSNFLQEKNYIRDEGVVEENVENYRKLALYLILNADLPALEDMTDTEGLESVIWTLPTVPPFLLAELLWGLRMGRFAAEAGALARPELALQLLAALAAHLRHLDPARHLPRARALAAAAHRLLARLHFHRRRDEAALQAVLKIFRTCLKCFVDPPNADRILALPRDDQHRHLARGLGLLLELVEECVRRYTGREALRAGGAAALYLATHAPGDRATDTLEFDICDGPDEAIQRCFAECHAALFDTCAALVMNVSVDVFCAWSEYDEGGVSVQRAVGELCHRVRGSLLAAAPRLPDHALPALLQHLARAPPAPAAPAAAAARLPVAELLRVAAGAGAEPAAWRAALLARADLCRHPPLLRLLDTHLSDLDEEQSRTLFNKITEYLNEDRENGEYLKVLATKAFHRCSLRDKRGIIERLFSDHLHDDLESVEFEKTANEILNRLTAAGPAGGAPGEVLTLFVQSPRRALERLFRAAAAAAPQAALVLALMDELRDYRAAFYAGDTEACLVKVANHAFENCLHTDRERENFAEFMRGLRERDVIPESSLLLQVAMPQLHAALLRRDAAAADAGLRLLARGLGAARLRPYRAPAAAMLAQLLAALTWAPAAFRPDVPPVRDRALDLLQQLFDCCGDEDMPEKELSWLSARLRRLPPRERAHFRRAPPAPLPPLPDLLQALPVLSAREWRFPLLAALRAAGAGEGEALLEVPAAALRRHAAHVAPACLLYALGNFVVHLQENYFSSPPAARQVLAALRAVAGVLERAPATPREGCAALLGPLAAALPQPGAGEGDGAREARAAAARCLRRAAPALAAALAGDHDAECPPPTQSEQHLHCNRDLT